MAGQDGVVYTANYNDTRGVWNGWFAVADPVAGLPPGAPVTVLSRATGLLDAFVAGQDGVVYTANYNDTRGVWNGWFAVADPVAGLPPGAPVTVLSRATGLLDAFVAGQDGVVYTANYNDTRGVWNGWFAVADPVAGLPPGAPVTVLSRATGLLDAFVTAQGREVYTANYNDTRGSWNGWFESAECDGVAVLSGVLKKEDHSETLACCRFCGHRDWVFHEAGDRKCSREFKVEAVRLVRERGVSATQAARDLGVHQNVCANG